MSPLPEVGWQYVAKAPVKVLYRWWYDTVAILDEYDDAEEGILPEGELITVVEVAQEAQRVLCDLANARRLRSRQLPKGRVRSLFLFCRATPLQADIALSEFGPKLERVGDGIR